VREFQRAGRPVVGSGPVGVEGTADWLDAVGKAANVPTKQIDAAKAAATSAIMGALAENMIDATVTVSGYEGSELLVARLLVEAGARVPYVGTACPKTEWSAKDAEWLDAHGVHVQYRASLEDDLYAMKDAKPDLALGTTPLVQAAKEMGIPSIYFTNMVSARPLFGPAGAGSLAGIVAAQTKGKERFAKMLDFFGEIGTGDMAGYGWTESRVEAAKKAAAAKPAPVAATDGNIDKKASITDAKAGKEDTLEMAIGN